MLIWLLATVMRFVWKVILSREKLFRPCVECSGVLLEIVNLKESLRIGKPKLGKVGIDASVRRSKVRNPTCCAETSSCHNNHSIGIVQSLAYLIQILVHIVQVGIAEEAPVSANYLL